jgi:hypothetical protein
MPHYNDNLTLDSIVLGNDQWEWDPIYYNEWSLKYGYLDEQRAYHSNATSGDLYFKIEVGSQPHVFLCGYMVKEAFKYANFLLDLHVKADRLANYKPSDPDTRVQWQHKKYIGDECKKLYDIPQGTHVLTVRVLDNEKSHKIGISHVIMWA